MHNYACASVLSWVQSSLPNANGNRQTIINKIIISKPNYLMS